MFGERTVLIRQDDARDRLKQHAVLAGELFQAPDKDAARFVEHGGLNAGGNQTQDLVLQRLAIYGNVVIEDDQVHKQSFHPPIGVSLDE